MDKKANQTHNVNISHPCPGLFRFSGFIGFLVVGIGTYYGGIELLGLEKLDWVDPAWTTKHVTVLAAGVILGLVAGLFCAMSAMTLEVKNECLSDFYIIIWQYFANGSLLWIMAMGIAMSISVGQEQAKAMVIQYGVDLATFHVAGTGSIVGILLGVCFFISPILRLPFVVYLIVAEIIALLAARWHFQSYGIDGISWIVSGAAFPILLLLLALPMIERDRRQRRLVTEESQP